MRPQTEELLYFLLWTADALLCPTWRNLDDSFEAWAWRNRLTHRLAELERDKLIERHPEPDLRRIVRLTQDGRRVALGGRDPVAQWSRPWDGSWRLILYDLPEACVRLRRQFVRVLRRHHFGYLQGSVWLTPDPADRLRTLLCGGEVQTEELLVIEGRPAAGESDQEIVSGAWDFTSIHRRWKRYLGLLERPPPLDSRLPEWGRQENIAWRNAIELDPLLPQQLLPKSYLGIKALQRRKQVFTHLAGLGIAGPTRTMSQL